MIDAADDRPRPSSALEELRAFVDALLIVPERLKDKSASVDVVDVDAALLETAWSSFDANYETVVVRRAFLLC